MRCLLPETCVPSPSVKTITFLGGNPLNVLAGHRNGDLIFFDVLKSVPVSRTKTVSALHQRIVTNDRPFGFDDYVGAGAFTGTRDYARAASMQQRRGETETVGCHSCVSRNEKIGIGALSNGTAFLWDTRCADHQILCNSLNTVETHLGDMRSIALSPLHDNYFCTGGADGTVRMWDLRRHPGFLTSFAITPADTSLTHKSVRRVHKGDVCSLLYSPDGALLISRGVSQRDGFDSKIWTVGTTASPRLRGRLEEPERIARYEVRRHGLSLRMTWLEGLAKEHLSWSTKRLGRSRVRRSLLAVGGSEGVVHVWDTEIQRLRTQLTDHRGVMVTDTRTVRPKKTSAMSHEGSSVVYHPSGQLLVAPPYSDVCVYAYQPVYAHTRMGSEEEKGDQLAQSDESTQETYTLC